MICCSGGSGGGAARVGVRPAAVASPYTQPALNHSANKNSMLDKFKLFNQKEKTKPSKYEHSYN